MPAAVAQFGLYISVTRILSSLSVLASLGIVGLGVFLLNWKYRQVNRASFRFAILIAITDVILAVFQLLNTAVLPAPLPTAAGIPSGINPLESSINVLGLQPAFHAFGASESEVLNQSTRGATLFIAWGTHFATLASIFAIIAFIVQSHYELNLVNVHLDAANKLLRLNKQFERGCLVGSVGLAALFSLVPVILYLAGATSVAGPSASIVLFTDHEITLASALYWSFLGIWILFGVLFAAYALGWAIQFLLRYQSRQVTSLRQTVTEPSNVLPSPSLCSAANSFDRYRDYSYKFCIRYQARQSVLNGLLSPLSPFPLATVDFVPRRTIFRAVLSVTFYAISLAICYLPFISNDLLAYSGRSSPDLIWSSGVILCCQGLLHALAFFTSPTPYAVLASYRADVYEKQRAREQAIRHGLLLCDDIIASPRSQNLRGQLSPISSITSDHTICCQSPAYLNRKSPIPIFNSSRSLVSLESLQDSLRHHRIKDVSLTRCHSLDTGISASVASQSTMSNASIQSLPNSWSASTTRSTPVKVDSLLVRSTNINALPVAPPIGIISTTSARKPSLSNRVMEWFVLRGQQEAPAAPRTIPVLTRHSRPVFDTTIAGRLSSARHNDLALMNGLHDFVETCNVNGFGFGFTVPYRSAWETRSSYYDQTTTIIA
ncbi:hypothetical protein H4R33_004644 [Dimargaris cristalligena]|nr:hypothetical protein H4R33_004644 [Dimargaris cristalligena]